MGMMVSPIIRIKITTIIDHDKSLMQSCMDPLFFLQYIELIASSHSLVNCGLYKYLSTNIACAFDHGKKKGYY
jgi:hypothetical protein